MGNDVSTQQENSPEKSWKKRLSEIDASVYVDSNDTLENEKATQIMNSMNGHDIQCLKNLIDKNKFRMSNIVEKRLKSYLPEENEEKIGEESQSEVVDEIDEEDDEDDEEHILEDEEYIAEAFSQKMKKLLMIYPSYIIKSSILTGLIMTKSEANAILIQEAKNEVIQLKKREEEKNIIYCQGEKEAIDNNKEMDIHLKVMTSLSYSGESVLIRLIESIWYCHAGGTPIRVVNATYHVRPKMISKFSEIADAYAKKHEFLRESMKPYLLFHGTSPNNHKSIISSGFMKKYIGSTTDKGYFGFGHYFSETPTYSRSYVRNHSKLIGCLVHVGKAKKIASIKMGCSRALGFDSHTSNCGNEVIIFDDHAILPCFSINFGNL